MFELFGRKKKQEAVIDLDAPLSPEADKFLGIAMAEFNAKQEALRRDWRFGSATRWAYDPPSGIFTLEFADGAQFTADGQLLGSFSAESFSWEWAWNNPNLEPAATRDSILVKQLGDRLTVAYLIVGMVPIPGDLWVSYLSAIGIKATNSVGAYRGKAGNIEAVITLKNPRWTKNAA
jgi:hypothetical protein